ncbi:unnamed protein product [Acanthosepion pharaonis]|uniref:Uncharacterized protein n=1 Tax=Acanthosepion pharaonis TaxID=158019 RepID=A0A812C8L2_ACAPH|nr:unnamed protein product [Sepia pharaonis]
MVHRKDALLKFTQQNKSMRKSSDCDILPYLLHSLDSVKNYFLDVSAVKAGHESSSREIRKLFSKYPLKSPESRSNSTSEVALQREISADLSVQVIQNLSFGNDLKSEMVQLRKSPNGKETVTNERPSSAPPPPPSRNSFVVKSGSENIEDWEVVENLQLSSENTGNQKLIDNIQDKEPVDSLSVFPSDDMDGNEASFLGLSLEEHRSRLSSLSKSDVQNKSDQQKKEDDIINASQHLDETQLISYDHGFSFISGNATPKMGRNTSLRRQILILRQENNQLREMLHENQNKIKNQEEQMRQLENSLLEKEEKNATFTAEDFKILDEDEDGNEDQKQVIENEAEDEINLNEKLSKLMKENKQFLERLELSNQVLDQENHDKKVSNLLQENLNLMQNLEQLTKKISSVTSDFTNEPNEKLLQVADLSKEELEVADPPESLQGIQELSDLKEKHVRLQSDYNNLVSNRDKLQEEYEQVQEEKDKLIFIQQRLKQNNEQATKQNCNLLNMKDNLQQELEEMIEQNKNLQEKYNRICEKTELLEKTVANLSASENTQKLIPDHFDETKELLEANKIVGSQEDNKAEEEEELNVLQLENSLLEEQCRKLLVEKDILEEANVEIKDAHDATVQLMNSEKEELQAEKLKLAEKLEEVTKENDNLQQKYNKVMQEIHLKYQDEDKQSNAENNHDTNSKIQMLENENTRLQQQIMQTEKRYEEIVENYRLHLISAVQGYIDPDVEKALNWFSFSFFLFVPSFLSFSSSFLPSFLPFFFPFLFLPFLPSFLSSFLPFLFLPFFPSFPSFFLFFLPFFLLFLLFLSFFSFFFLFIAKAYCYKFKENCHSGIFFFFIACMYHDAIRKISK